MSEPKTLAPEIARRVVQIQALTLIWMTVEAAVSLGAAWQARSPALLGFGGDSAVELLSAAVVLRRFYVTSQEAHAEKRAAKIACGLLFVLAAFVVLASALSLLGHMEPQPSVVGIAVLIVAAVAMPWLAREKRRLSGASGSASLRADAAESAVCGYLALIALAGLAVNAIWGIRWTDPVAALALLPLIVREGWEAMKGKPCCPALSNGRTKTMEPEEKLFWETFITVHPEFLTMKSWIPGPEPPDLIITDASDRKLGIELTEWLDKRQTTPSISTTENEMKWLNALDTESSPPPQHFQSAHLWFRSGTQFSQREKASFRKEFYELISHVDGSWEREMAGTPQKIWNDFSKYPTLGKHLHLIRFEDRAPFKPQRWALGTPKGGAYDPRWATEALLERIEEKKSKRNYTSLKTQYGLAELILLLHYGIRGLLHNAPFEGASWKIEDVVSEARTNLARDSGHFDRVFLYLAYNEGRFFTLYA